MDHLKVETDFQVDIKNHTMEILKDDGVFRHIVVSNNGDFNHKFEITTWPNYLCFTGDMGCFIFNRTHDMFNFFSGQDINPSYWSEKLEAGKYNAYCPQTFQDNIKSEYDTWVNDNELDPAHEACLDLWEEIENEVIMWSTEHEIRAYDAASSFEMDCGDLGTFTFPDFWEHDNNEFTYHYLWSLHAIRWCIKKYKEKE